MPKMTAVFGDARFNLAYSIIGFTIANGGFTTLKELAKHLEYREDEILGVIKQINDVDPGNATGYYGLPVYFDIDALEEGNVELLDNMSDVNVPRLTTRQTAALSAGLTMLKQMQGFEHNEDIDVLLAALHESGSSVTTDTIKVEPTKPDSDLEVIRKAILDSVAIKCDYRNGQGDRTFGRVIEPLRLESRDNLWYLRGFCHNRNDLRNFRLDQMDKVELTELPITDEHKALPLDGPIYQPGSDAISVVIEVQPEAYQVLNDYNATYEGKLTTGVVRAEIKVTSLLTLPPMVASYGGAVRVLEPTEARQQVREFALRALGRGAEIIAEKTE